MNDSRSKPPLPLLPPPINPSPCCPRPVIPPENIFANVVSPASTNVWDRYEGPTNSMSQSQADALSDRAGNLNRAQDLANPAEPVVPGTPSDGSYRQSAPLGADGKPMKQMASKINTGNMIREYIDIDTTARMWILRESLGKPRGGIYLSEAGVHAIFREVARRSVVNEGPMLDKLRGFNQRANAAIGRVATPIKQTLRRGAESATNKITFRDLMLNWQRSAKMDKESSVDSEKVIDFLHGQGVKDLLIRAAFAKLGLKADPQTAGTPGVAGTAGGFGAGFLQGLGPEFAKSAEAWKQYNATTGGKSKGRTQFNVSKLATPAATPAAATQEPQTAQQTAQATATAEQPPAVWKSNRNLNAPASTSPQAAATATTPATTTPTDTTTPASTTKRTGGKVAGQLSTDPRAVARRDANAAKKAATTQAGAGAFGNMAAQLAARPTTSSTGGTTTGVAGVGNGVVKHTANPNNPNLQPATTTAADTTAPAKKTAPQTANPFAGLGQQPASTFTGRQPKKAKANVAEPVAETRMDFGAMLFDRMKKQS